ncbi:hypothetical protein AB0L65_62145 [Nonomuraea sp. NPDC052116]|uniref:hypothetical protein n=1 Tax=Nonomuraea sp. NPDC052116 TaxID=3155665 RepID=UPI00341C96FF
MRPSQRTRILDAAIRVTERDGITALALESAAEEAVEACVRVGAHGSASKADLAFMVESVTTPAPAEAWDDLIGRWAPPPTSTDPRDIDLPLAQPAVDGLWLWRATSMIPLSEPVGKALHDRLLKLVAAKDADAG